MSVKSLFHSAGVSFACTYCGSMPGYQLNCLTMPSACTSGLSARSMNFFASAAFAAFAGIT